MTTQVTIKNRPILCPVEIFLSWLGCLFWTIIPLEGSVMSVFSLPVPTLQNGYWNVSQKVHDATHRSKFPPSIADPPPNLMGARDDLPQFSMFVTNKPNLLSPMDMVPVKAPVGFTNWLSIDGVYWLLWRRGDSLVNCSSFLQLSDSELWSFFYLLLRMCSDKINMTPRRA